MKKELISVIVPIYNVEKYLPRCIESIINQTYTNLEIILVDDGSPDKCGEICDEYARKDARIKVIHKENGGLSDARNAGIEIAIGQYIAFVDSDDFIASNMYEVLHKNIKETNSDIAITNFYKFENEEEIVEIRQEEKIIIYNREEMFRHMYDNYLLTVVAWNKLYKRQIFKQIRYPVGKIIEDSAIVHYLIDKSTKIVISNLQLYFYYQRTDSIMNTPNLALLDELDFLYDRVKFFEKLQMEDSETYNITIENYITKYIELYCKFAEAKKYKKDLYKNYSKKMNELMKKYKFTNIKRKIKFNLFFFSKYLYYFLKKLKKQIDKAYIKRSNKILKNKYIKYKKRMNKQEKAQYLIFNAPNHGNLGDHAILVAEQTILKEKGIESFSILSHDTQYFLDNFSKDIKSQDVIMITGGGNFGTIWEHEQIRANQIIKKFKNNKIIIFPQTIYYSDNIHGAYAIKRDKEVYNLCEKLTICCREKRSYDFCKKTFNEKNIVYTTDVVTYLDNYIKYNKKRSGIQLCFRQDVEKTTSQEEIRAVFREITQKYPNEKIVEISTLNKGKYNLKKGKKDFIKLIKNISKSKLIITDRLHGMIFAAITATPCITFPNSSGKVKGVYEWLKKENDYIYFINSIKDLQSIINEIDIGKTYKYNNKNMKNSLKNII